MPGLEHVVIQLPLTKDAAARLRTGMSVRISGVMYGARDQAHARMVAALERGEPLPFDASGALIYYVGPSPGRGGRAVGAAGPTTSARMDPFVEPMLRAGVLGMMGKGPRSQRVKSLLVSFGAVYFVAVGGAGALLGKQIVRAEVIAYDDLGTEALRRLEVTDFPAFVACDAHRGDIFDRDDNS